MSMSTTDAWRGTEIVMIPSSHLDLFWLGDYRNCLRRGNEVIASYLDRMERYPDETFVIDTAIFAEHFLRTRPEYESRVRDYIREGRLQVGSAYIDRWENLVLGESIIRNIQIGTTWVKTELGVSPSMVGHPDLPGLNSQTSQIYAQAGVKYYVTSRKIFQEGRVWRHRAPDGTALHIMTWPVHYVFAPIEPVTLPDDNQSWVAEHSITADDLDARYPLRRIAVSGSAGDLTNEVQFLERYRRDIREYLDEYRRTFTGSTVRFGVPADVMEGYLDTDVDVREIEGSLPSVWGVAADEEARFFTRARRAERLLLAAETAGVIALLDGRAPIPASAAQWQGLNSEDAFFADKDHPPTGRAFEWLWRMHVFTQDHNGGGQDGTLSTFQKRVRQDRLFAYAEETIRHALESQPRPAPALFTDRLGPSVTRLVVDDLELVDALPASVPRQDVVTATGRTATALGFDPVSGVGVHPIDFSGAVDGFAGARHEGRIRIDAGDHIVEVDQATGAVSVEAQDGRVTPLGIHRLNAVAELGDDVTLHTDDHPQVATVTRVGVVSEGPLAVQVRIDLRLLEVEWAVLVTAWQGQPYLDVDVFVRWPALERVQVRLPLVGAAAADAVEYGTPFHSSIWSDVPSEAGPLMQDEISVEDFQQYREVQHWIADHATGLLVTTQHPGFHLADGQLSAVLMRTPPSCGDRRMIWENAGANAWSYRVYPGVSDVAAAAPELAQRDWRKPIPVRGTATTPALEIVEGAALLSALYTEGGTVVARLVNESAHAQSVRLRGAAVGTDAVLEDLAGAETAVLPVVAGEVHVLLAPWRIQTIRFK